MDLSDLQTFLSVARTKGITAAGRELNTVPSNVTARIKSLEAEIGTALFDRHSRGMTLTQAGQRLLPYAERLLTLSREARAAARDDGVPRGQLAIGSMETTAAVRLPAVLTRYHRDYPQVRLTLGTGPTAQLIDAVLARDLDAAFVAGPVDHPALAAHAAFEEELVLVTPAALRTIADVRRLAGEGLSALMFRVGCSYRQRLEQALAELGLGAYARLELGTLDGILGCVAAGMGVTVLPRAVVAASAHARQLHCHTLPASLARVATVLVTRRDVALGTAFERLKETIQAPDPPPAAARAEQQRGEDGKGMPRQP